MSDGSGRRDDISRRSLLRAGGSILGGAAFGPLLSGCSGTSSPSTPGSTITIGFVSPITGAASGFGEPDPYVIDLARRAFASGLRIGGRQYPVQILTRDGQSTPSVAAAAASDLIHRQGVHLMLATSTPETVNPVSDASEAAGVPCISTAAPWEAWYFGRGAKPGQPSPFRYTYHFFVGVAELLSAYTHLWPQVATNSRVGVMWPDDPDGNAIRQSLGPLLEKAGYTVIDPGAYPDGTADYSSQITLFKREGIQIFNTFPLPPDFAVFWRQAAQDGLTSQLRIVQLAKTGLVPSQIDALGSAGLGMANAFYWTPTFPYRSSLTGVTSAQLASGYEHATGRQWNQQLGASLALFDVARAALVASGDPTNRTRVADAMKNLEVETPLGRLRWGGGPVSNVVTTPTPGGQWVKGTRWPFDFVVCESSSDPNIPVASHLTPYSA